MADPSPDVPRATGPDPDETWPSRDLVDYFLGTGEDFELRLGEQTPIPVDDPDAAYRARRFRDVLGVFATGVTVVTSMADAQPVGMTCQSFSSVSLEPPLVMFCPARTSRTWPSMLEAGHFCVNFLSSGQKHVSHGMATRGPGKFEGVGWKPSPITGSPLIDGVLGWVDCRVEQVHEAGDHYIVVGRVLDLDFGDGTVESPESGVPLLFHRGSYTRPE